MYTSTLFQNEESKYIARALYHAKSLIYLLRCCCAALKVCKYINNILLNTMICHMMYPSNDRSQNYNYYQCVSSLAVHLITLCHLHNTCLRLAFLQWVSAYCSIASSFYFVLLFSLLYVLHNSVNRSKFLFLFYL